MRLDLGEQWLKKDILSVVSQNIVTIKYISLSPSSTACIFRSNICRNFNLLVASQDQFNTLNSTPRILFHLSA